MKPTRSLDGPPNVLRDVFDSDTNPQGLRMGIFYVPVLGIWPDT